MNNQKRKAKQAKKIFKGVCIQLDSKKYRLIERSNIGGSDLLVTSHIQNQIPKGYKRILESPEYVESLAALLGGKQEAYLSLIEKYEHVKHPTQVK